MKYGFLIAAAVACSSVTAPAPAPGVVRLVTFGDSNTEGGWNAQNTEVEWSYISAERPLTPAYAPNGSHQLAGKIEHLDTLFHVVDHAASGRTTGDAVTAWQGITMFEAEVLGLGGKTWDNGSGIPRVLSFIPNARDYAYVSLGTTDWSEPHFIQADSTIKNLEWMAQRWISAGLPSKHFIITTLPPRTGSYGRELPSLNPKIRGLALKYHLSIIDLSSYASPDDGITWRSPSFNVGDGTHYAEFVRDWLARSIVEIVRSER